MATVEKLIKSVSDSGITRVVILAFMFGAAWARFEYKSDRDKQDVLNALEKHIINDLSDKKIIDMKIETLKSDFDKYIADLKISNEFLRPEDMPSYRGKGKRK